MTDLTRWAFPPALQPTQGEVAFDLESALEGVVGLRAEVPDDAFTASILGTDRTGNGVVIRDDGLVLTIGYLITEASSVWLTRSDGSVVEGHPLAYDFATGFGLVLPLGKLDVPMIERGSATTVAKDDEVYVVGHGGRAHALKATVFAKREFAGFWEYLLDTALFTTPPHPEWSGAALLDEQGRLIGVGSLLLQERAGDDVVDGNMFVPVDLIEPILDDLVRTGRSAELPRPWLGMYTADRDGRLVVNGSQAAAPPSRPACTRETSWSPSTRNVSGAWAILFREIWRLGPAGTDIPLTLARGGAPVYVKVASGDRNDFLRKPSLQ